MRWIYISPHFDDAALCAGGLIHDQVRAGLQVEIWTVMSGIPPGENLPAYARVMHGRWATTTAEQTIHLRLEEDRRAAAILGAAVHYLYYLDAIYRTTAEGQALYGDPIGASMHSADAALILRIATTLTERLDTRDCVVSPLGIGHHVDHVIVRKAAETAASTLHYMADFPYVVQYPGTVQSAVGGLQSTLHPVSEPGLAAWIDAVAAYPSQTRAVFGDAVPESLIRAYKAQSGGLRLWQRRALDSGGEP